MTAKLSRTAFGEPGRLTINVPERMPQTPREIMAIGVCLSVSLRMASARPGASRSITASVASGVLSRGAKPVPPVVTMRLTSGEVGKFASAYRRADRDRRRRFWSRQSQRQLFEQLNERFAGFVLALAAGTGVADRDALLLESV